MITFRDQFIANISAGPWYADDLAGVAAPDDPLVRLIAFYLPQFHPIPENDLAWGKGFTEWTNVTRAQPRFVGHYQPHLPGALGFYDLRLAETIRQQADLARRYGIGGFCFHYYWFNGKRLLDTPLRILLANPAINMPFCINWANENWTRNWDGGNRELLQEQRHSFQDDLAFAQSMVPFMQDKRYIRINNRPVLMCYRPKVLPDAAATVRIWRSHLTTAGVGDPYVIMCHSFDADDPGIYGMDAAVGFPPHQVGSVPDVTGLVTKLDPEFQGRVGSYEMMANQACELPRQTYRYFHGVCPSWDSEPRQPGRGISYVGSSPQAYSSWLARACRRALDEQVGDERLVFINAWNEWGESAYLEPDRHFGYAYLAATAQALNSLKA